MTAAGPADRALLAALAAWAGPDALPILRRVGPDRAPSLARAFLGSSWPDPTAELACWHADQARPDPARVHPSWYARALREESAAVRSAVLRALPEPLRSDLHDALAADVPIRVADRPVDPDVLAFALSAWTERIVGDGPARDDDPAVVAAIAAVGPVGRARLARLVALAKLSDLPDRSSVPVRSLGPARRAAFARLIPAPTDPRLIALAARDWEATARLGRHRLVGLALTTLARLLRPVEANRARWALQHLPYAVAKRVRGLMAAPEAAVRSVIDREAAYLTAALARQAEERTRSVAILDPGTVR